MHVKKKRSTNITYKSSPRSRRRIPPATVNAPRTAGVPETGTFGVGTETIGDGVATTMTTCRVGIGVAVATTVCCVGVGVAVDVGAAVETGVVVGVNVLVGVTVPTGPVGVGVQRN